MTLTSVFVREVPRLPAVKVGSPLASDNGSMTVYGQAPITFPIFHSVTSPGTFTFFELDLKTFQYSYVHLLVNAILVQTASSAYKNYLIEYNIALALRGLDTIGSIDSQYTIQESTSIFGWLGIDPPVIEDGPVVGDYKYLKLKYSAALGIGGANRALFKGIVTLV